jgi:hypothetical protein
MVIGVRGLATKLLPSEAGLVVCAYCVRLQTSLFLTPHLADFETLPPLFYLHLLHQKTFQYASFDIAHISIVLLIAPLPSLRFYCRLDSPYQAQISVQESNPALSLQHY